MSAIFGSKIKILDSTNRICSKSMESRLCACAVEHYEQTVSHNLNSLHAEMICTLPFINAEINVISLRSKWQALPSKPWAVPVG